MTQVRSRRRSRAVNLAIVGTAGGMMVGLGGCSSAHHQRNVYDSMADCAQDYSLATCSAKGEQGNGRFLGPAYRVQNGRPSSCSVSDPGSGMGLRSPRRGVERTGFGYSCRSRSGGSRLSGWGG